MNVAAGLPGNKPEQQAITQLPARPVARILSPPFTGFRRACG
ncbi:hypothetical protein O3W44_19895 [Pantoea sp. LMR881]|nr:hypothetical protein [Pantoea sp. LMR881]MCZ4060863.1 hypothetical protein [Pantoea sp. LMR881]